jgi:hypothetical protein
MSSKVARSSLTLAADSACPSQISFSIYKLPLALDVRQAFRHVLLGLREVIQDHGFVHVTP